MSSSGLIIKTVRNFRKLTQGELAEQLEVSRSYLSGVEGGSRAGGLKMLRRVSVILKIPIPLLFIDDSDDSEIGHKLRDIRKEFIDTLWTIS